MNYKQTLELIHNLKGSEDKGHFNLSLENIKILLKKLGNPEKSLKVIHVAGTNGKGSVCAMVASVLIEAGYKVGMYTSPHLKDFRERFIINNKQISEDDVVRYLSKVKPLIKDETFFEVVTAMAFLYFKDKKVDYLVLEVGLGGRLDATNVVKPLVSVITNIGLEHQEYLGETIEKIAYEKAGIIKNKIPVVTGASGAALEVIKKIAKENDAEMFIDGKPIKVPLRLKGEFQLINASIALETINVLNQYYNLEVSDRDIKNGFLKTVWHGRLEFISKNLLVDCAHNLDAVKVLKKDFLKIKKEYGKLYLVFGVLEDKDYKSMLDELCPLADSIVLVKPKILRAVEPKVLAKYVKNGVIIEDVRKALEYVKGIMRKEDLILVTGSIYVVGEII